LVSTPGGKELLEKPVRAIVQWVEFDRIATTNCSVHEDEPIEIVKLNQMHLVIALLLHDFRTTKNVEKQILTLNQEHDATLNEAMENLQNTIQSPVKSVVDGRKNDHFIQKFNKLEHEIQPKSAPKVLPEATVGCTNLRSSTFEPKSEALPEISVAEKSEKPKSIKLAVNPPVVDPQMLMAQQMTLLTQMMSMMQQNMLQQQHPPFPAVQSVPTRNPMYQRAASYDANLRQISPRKLKEETNKALKKIHGIPLLDLPMANGKKSTVKRVEKENIFRRTMSAPSEPRQPEPAKMDLQLIGLHHDQAENRTAKKCGKFQLLEFGKVATFVSGKKQTENVKKRLLIETGQLTSHRAVQKPVTLPQKEPVKKLDLGCTPEIENVRPKNVVEQKTEPKRPEMVLIDYDRIGKEIRKNVDEAYKDIEGTLAVFFHLFFFI